MTPDELETLVLRAKDPFDIQRALAALNESQRKKLSTAANKLFSQFNKGEPNKDASARLKTYFLTRRKNVLNTWDSTPLRNTTLALFALCPLSRLKRQTVYVGRENAEVLTQIVLDRRPDWLDDWIDYELAQEFSSLEFPVLRHWMKAGACKKPTSDGYYRLFAHDMKSIAYPKEPPRPPLSHQLLTEPDLLEDVWPLFRVESDAFESSPWIPHHAPDDYEIWPDALLKLAESGHLDRQRLLDESLKGLTQDFKQSQLSGMHKFHKSLAPSKEERSARQADYLALLSHKVGHVCKFSLENLGQIEKEGRLDSEAFLDEVPAVFLQDHKGNAVAALKLIKRMLKNQSCESGQMLCAVAEALQNANTDVQELALDILQSRKGELNEDVRDVLKRVSDFLSPSLQMSLADLLGDDASNQWPSEESVPSHDEIPDEVIRGLGPLEKRALGIDDLFSTNGAAYAPISDNIMDHAVLPAVEPIEPIETEDELIAVVSHAVELVESPDDVERIIDAVSRLCGSRSDDFEAKTRPLRHRLEKGGSESSKGLLGIWRVQHALLDLLLTWLTPNFYRTSIKEYYDRPGAFEPTIDHLRTVTERVARREAAPLLSAPTHSGGWIDPLVWMSRLRGAEERGSRHDSTDLCLSLLRLAPDGRSVALQLAEGLSEDFRRVATLALGGKAKLTSADRKNYDTWICATRAADPYADWSTYFAPLKLDDGWPDSLQPARIRWQAYHDETKAYEGRTWKIPRLDIDVDTASTPAAPDEPQGLLGSIKRTFASLGKTDWRKLPTAALHQRVKAKSPWLSDLEVAWVSEWLAYVWPLCPSGAYISGARALMLRMDQDSSNWSPGYGYLKGLFMKNRPWRDAGHLLLSLGLASKDADTRGFAIDALIEGIEAGQLDVEMFAQILADLSKGEWLKLNRLGDNFMRVIQTSPLHAWAIGDCIQLWLPRIQHAPKSLFRILEVLLEAQSTTGQSLSPDTIAVLKRQKGSSKTAKLAKKLLEPRHVNQSASATVRHLAVRGRLEATARL